VGYYAVASGAIAQAIVPGKFRSNMADPIPAVVLARLAVDRNHQGRGLGRAMFRDAALRVAQAAETLGFEASSFMRSLKRRKDSTSRSASTRAPQKG
jgi:GNAT superfamily N-acetyltransferase